MTPYWTNEFIDLWGPQLFSWSVSYTLVHAAFDKHRCTMNVAFHTGADHNCDKTDCVPSVDRSVDSEVHSSFDMPSSYMPLNRTWHAWQDHPFDHCNEHTCGYQSRIQLQRTHVFSNLDHYTKNRKRVNSLSTFADEKQGKNGDFPQFGKGVFWGSGLVDEGQRGDGHKCDGTSVQRVVRRRLRGPKLRP